MDFISGRIFASTQLSKISSFYRYPVKLEKNAEALDLVVGQRWLIFMLITTTFHKYHLNEAISAEITVRIVVTHYPSILHKFIFKQSVLTMKVTIGTSSV